MIIKVGTRAARNKYRSRFRRIGMSIIYLDTSALLKLYIQEKRSEEVGALLLRADGAGTSSSCYLVLADGSNVLLNVRYAFPEALKSTLADILSKQDRLTRKLDSATFMQACQWHMDNFDMGNVG